MLWHNIKRQNTTQTKYKKKNTKLQIANMTKYKITKTQMWQYTKRQNKNIR